MQECRPHARRQRGLTLPETLAALIALAIVILSIASVYLERERAVPGLALRQAAHALAAQLGAQIEQGVAESIRSEGAPVFYENPVGVVCQPELKLGQRSDRKAPQPHDLAANSVACWQVQVSERLPNGTGAISLDSSSVPPAYAITVNWSESGARTASYVLRVPTPPMKSLPATASRVPVLKSIPNVESGKNEAPAAVQESTSSSDVAKSIADSTRDRDALSPSEARSNQQKSHESISSEAKSNVPGANDRGANDPGANDPGSSATREAD